jgi:hypothetical protein
MKQWNFGKKDARIVDNELSTAAGDISSTAHGKVSRICIATFVLRSRRAALIIAHERK